MTLVNLNELLQTAKKKKYGIGAFNVVDFEMIKSLIAAAEKENFPIIIQYAEGDDHRIPIEEIGLYASYLIQKSSVPICLHLDHGNTFSAIVRAIKSGFTSVMMDASSETYMENVRRTKEAVKLAHSFNVSVEAEIGRMINAEHEVYQEDQSLLFEETFTDPEIAGKFADETQADAIAVSFGTIHGVYAQKPQLDFERLQKISEVVKQPLVVHGGSGLSEEEYHKMVECGISKINFYSEMSYTVARKIQKNLSEKTQRNEKYFLQTIVEMEKEYVEQEIRKMIQVFQGKSASTARK